MNDTITLDSSIEEVYESIMIIDSDGDFNDEKSNLKRELSIQLLSQEEPSKKTKTFHGREKKNIRFISLKEFLANDPRLDSRLFFNRIDEENIDYDLVAWSHLEVILDQICFNSICFTVEHYYNQLLKKKRFDEINTHYEKLKLEYELIYKNKVPLFDTELFQESKIEFEHQINRTEEARKALGYELRSFARFIKNIYDDSTKISLY